MWWIFYEAWSSVTSMQETPKEGWVSALPFPLLWFTSHSSKLTFTRMGNRTDRGHTYPQEICDLYGNNLYCVSYICLCYLKEKRFSAYSCAPNLSCHWGHQRRWGLNILPEQRLMPMDWKLEQVKFQITADTAHEVTD